MFRSCRPLREAASTPFDTAPTEISQLSDLATHVDGSDGAVAFECFPALNRKAPAMDWYVIEVNWHKLKGRIKEHWGHLTDEDLDKIAGKREQLASRLVQLYGLNESAADEEIDDWMFTEENRMNIQKSNAGGTQGIIKVSAVQVSPIAHSRHR